PASAQQQPNIVMIMGDDIGIWNIGTYHRGMMAGRTPNLDQLAAEGMLFTDYYAEASCTAGRANFITGELPIRTGLTTVGWPLCRTPGRRWPLQWRCHRTRRRRHGGPLRGRHACDRGGSLLSDYRYITQCRAR